MTQRSPLFSPGLPATAGKAVGRLRGRKLCWPRYSYLGLVSLWPRCPLFAHAFRCYCAPRSDHLSCRSAIREIFRRQRSAYFADGMTDELIAHLAKIRSLRVISRTSSMEYKGTHKTLSQIARDLNAMPSWKARCCVRVTACESPRSSCRWLPTATSGRNLTRASWADILTLQSHVTSAIVNENQSQTDTRRPSAARCHPPRQHAELRNYLKGAITGTKGPRKASPKPSIISRSPSKRILATRSPTPGLADCYSIIGSAIVGTVPTAEVAPKPRRRPQVAGTR